MARNGKIRGPDRLRTVKTKRKNKSLSFKEIDLCKIVPKPFNYAKIANGLRIKLGPNDKHSIIAQLWDRGLRSGSIKQLDEDKKLIDKLYLQGYDIEDLYAQLVGRIQEEILKGLPF